MISDYLICYRIPKKLSIQSSLESKASSALKLDLINAHMDLEKAQERLELLTSRRLFFIAFILVGFIPPIAEKGYNPSDMGYLIPYLLANSLLKQAYPIYPLFKVLPIFLIFALILGKANRIFSLYAGVTYILFAFLQGISVTERYGLAVITGNIVQMLIVSALWIWEAVVRRNRFTSPNLRNCWAIPLAFLAFWYPLNPESKGPDFNPSYLLTNAAGLAFCTMTPVYLTVLLIYYPNVNKATMRVTSLAGAIIGFWNMFNFLSPYGWWNGVLHLPLLLISVYALILSLKSQRVQQM